MNRLPFGSFHAHHFSPQQVQHWQSYLQQIQSTSSDQHYPQQETPQYTEEYQDQESWAVDQDGDHENHLPLSKEAIAIFEFSEAYSAQRNQGITEENNDEKHQHEINTILNVSTTLHHDGIEVPPTSLVILSLSSPLSGKQSSPSIPTTSTRHQTNQSNSIATKQHLLNSSYLESCNQPQNQELSQLVMWPVLPFRL